MPPKFKFERQEIIAAGLEQARLHGLSGVTARGVADRLGASPKVIFSLFENMEELTGEVKRAAYSLYTDYLTEDMAADRYPKYKASGMAYIRFAKEEPRLFRLLFMCDRTAEDTQEEGAEMEMIYKIIEQNVGLDREEARLFHAEMWVFVHGIGSMLATNYLQWSMELISEMMTDIYAGLKLRFLQRKEGNT